MSTIELTDECFTAWYMTSLEGPKWQAPSSLHSIYVLYIKMVHYQPNKMAVMAINIKSFKNLPQKHKA